jgi:hypothetical protein
VKLPDGYTVDPRKFWCVQVGHFVVWPRTFECTDKAEAAAMARTLGGAAAPLIILRGPKTPS